MSWVATAIVGGAVIGGITTAYSSNKASKVQSDAAKSAAAVNQNQLDFAKGVNATNQANLRPFMDEGKLAMDKLNTNLDDFGKPMTFNGPSNQVELEATPGYQFAKTQGLKAVQNSAAARGLGISGASLKGAATFATGLADQTYGNQFQRSLDTFNANRSGKSDAFNRLSTLIQGGSSAAAAAAGAGNTAAGTAVNAGNNVAGNIIGAGNAGAGGILGEGAGIAGIGNTVAGWGLAKTLYPSRLPAAPPVGDGGNYGG